jgi:cold shock CspA family protein
MARNGETIGKKEKEKKRKQKAKDKEERRQERAANPVKSTDEFAYLDENGNLSDTPPDPAKRREISLEEISHTGIGAVEAGPAPDATRSGTITYYNTEKAYGFIKDKKTGESIFVHASALSSPVRENDRVTFKTERTPKGMSAVDVQKEA